jgi:concanavalin A-like lectin/glucanase superfamily protein/putative Ig domain-containing protein
MPTISCASAINQCLPCDDFPIVNNSNEAPDQDRYIGRFAFLNAIPPIRQLPDFDDQGGGIFLQVGCMRWCWSTVSQDEADDCARRQAVECAFAPLVPDMPIPTEFSPNRIALFYNQAVTGFYTCPDGNQFFYTVAARAIAAFSLAQANHIAAGLAILRARQHRVCLSNLDEPICENAFYTKQITASGPYVAVFPNSDLWELVSGTIPTGMTLESGFQLDGIMFSGIPTTIGEYTFRVRCTIRTLGSPGFGDFMEKVFTVKVVGIEQSSPLPDATLGVAYSQQLSAAFSSNHELETWSITSGSLPDGLTLSTAGLISGTPTGGLAGYQFTVQAQFPVGNHNSICWKSFTITTIAASTLLDGLLFSNPLNSHVFLGPYPTAYKDPSLGANAGDIVSGDNLVAGKLSNAGRFVSSSIAGFMSTNGVLNFPAGIFTYAFWLKINAVSGTDDVLSISPPSSGYILRLAPTGVLTFFIGDGAIFYSVSSPALSVGAWHHVVITCLSGVEITIRVSTEAVFGVKNTSVAGVLAPAAPLDAISILDPNPGPNDVDMALDELDCWGRVITNAEAQEHWNSGNGIQWPF